MVSFVRLLLLTLVMVSAASATSELSDGFRGISNILLQEIATHQIGCIPTGQRCDNGREQDCCWGNTCKTIPVAPGGALILCGACPTAGSPCGLMDPCCPGLSCDGYAFGTCH